jgi:hypothetical protein
LLLALVSSIAQSVTLALAIMSGAAGLAILSGHGLPRWPGWLGRVTAALGLIGVLAIPAGYTINGLRLAIASANPLSLLLWLIWVVGVSGAFLRSPAVHR